MTPDLRDIRRTVEKRKAKVAHNAKEKKENKERKYPELIPKAKGDLGTIGEDEEDQAMAEELWENYKRSGGTRTREQFDEDQMIKACEDYLKVELKFKADVSERQLAEAQWSHLLKATLDAVLIHLIKGGRLQHLRS